MGIIDKIIIEEVIKSNRVLCPNCGVNLSNDCGYSLFDYDNEFSCEAPEEIEEECDNCKHIWCNECKEKERIFMILQEEDFII